MKWTTAGAAALTLMVAACGTDRDERVGGGAAAGAATGAGIGALGGPVGALAGAGIGGVAGGVTGYATGPETVNLGRPLWSDPEVRTPMDRDRSSYASHSSSSSGRSTATRSGSDSVRQAQSALNQRGFDSGAADGIWGPQTSRAATEFQRANNLEPTGRLDSATMQALDMRSASTATGAPAGSSGGMSGGGAPMTPSTGPGGTSNVGSGNQPATGGTSQGR